MSDCKVFRTEIDEAADGGALSGRAAAHAAACAACGESLRAREALRGLVRGLGRVEAPPDFEFRLRARMASSRPGGGGGLFARLFPVSGLAWAAVAVCVLSVTAVVYYRQARPARSAAPNAAEVASAPQAPASPTAVTVNQSDETTAQATDAVASVASGVTAPAATQRNVASKRGPYQSRENVSVARESRDDSARGGSIDATVGTARVVVPLRNAGVNVVSNAPVQGIQLGTAAGTLRVVLRDERGALVPMRTVSFGSQEPLSRQTAGARVSPKDDEGVW